MIFITMRSYRHQFLTTRSGPPAKAIQATGRLRILPFAFSHIGPFDVFP
jgi:hypothetical protein